MSNRLNIVLGLIVATNSFAFAALSDPKNSPGSMPVETPFSANDLVGVPDIISDMDFGDPLPGAFDSRESDDLLLEEEVGADPAARPDYSAMPEEGLAGLKEFGAHLLQSLQANDPEKLGTLPSSIVGKVDEIIADPSILSPEQIEVLMQHFVDLGREGYAVNMAPKLPDIEMPIFEAPVMEAIPLLPEPFVFEQPEPLYAQPIYEGPNVYGAVETETTPFASVGANESSDFQFGTFFQVPLKIGVLSQAVHLNVETAGLLAPRLLYDSQQHGGVGISLHQAREIESYLNPEDLIAVTPGEYIFSFSRNQAEAEMEISARIDFREMRDRTEPNDVKEQAVPITLPFRTHLFLEGINDVDWLTFTVAEEGVLSVSGVSASISITQSDDTPVPVSASSSGTRYAIIQPGTYFARVVGERSKRTGKVTLRFYPPSGIGAEINRIIGVGLENNAEVSTQMRAVSYATGAPLIETTEAAEIASALDEAAGSGGGLSWAWLATFFVLGLVALAAVAYGRRQQ